MEERPNLSGKWLLTKCENFANFLRQNGITENLSNKAENLICVQEIRHDGDNIKVHVSTNMFTHDQSIEVGKDHIDTSHGPSAKVCSKWEGQKLVLTLYPIKKRFKTMKITRELLENGDLLMTLEVGDVVARRWYTKTEGLDIKLTDTVPPDYYISSDEEDSAHPDLD